MMFKKIKRILYRGFEGKDITYETAKKIIKKEKECYLIDVRSKKGKEILENMGYKNVYSLKHGISGINWKIKQVAYLFFLNKICISKKYLVDNIK